MTGTKLTPVKSTTPSSVSGEVLEFRCARPKCRNKFGRTLGPGRPKYYCSDECRLLARDEKRTIRARLESYEELVEQARGDLASYGRSGGDDEEATEQPELVGRRATEALIRVEGVLTFAPDSNPLTRELRAIVEAVGPLLRSPVSRAS